MNRELGFLFGFLVILIPQLKAGDRQEGSQDKPLNVILMIGDGMGLPQLSIPYYYLDEEPVFSRCRHIGLVRTSAATSLITQSSAAATAMSTGVKTYNLALGVGVDSLPVRNMVEILSEKGYLTGVISTSSITDATPGGFYAHVTDRGMHRQIARDLTESEIDFFAGGGLKHFIDTTSVDHFALNKIKVNFSELTEISDPEPGYRYGFILGMDRMPAMLEGRGSYLADASVIAMDFLSSPEKGYFLMIEGSQIDWGGHGNHAEYMITEMNDFHHSVQTVLKKAEEEGNTLVIVTSDHETGGFTLAASGTYDDVNYDTISPVFATRNHSASLVPLLAYGPGAEYFTGIYENTDIFHKVMFLLTGQKQTVYPDQRLPASQSPTSDVR